MGRELSKRLLQGDTDIKGDTSEPRLQIHVHHSPKFGEGRPAFFNHYRADGGGASPR